MNGRFQFRGQTLLKLRQQREQTARQDFTLGQADVDAVEARLETLRATLGDYHQAARQAVVSGDAVNLKLYRHFAVQVEQVIRAEEAQLASARAMLEECRSALEAARKETKVVQALKDRRQSNHDALAEQQAVKDRDDQYASHVAAIRASLAAELAPRSPLDGRRGAEAQREASLAAELAPRSPLKGCADATAG